jgi:hypothetical protein
LADAPAKFGSFQRGLLAGQPFAKDRFNLLLDLEHVTAPVDGKTAQGIRR